MIQRELDLLRRMRTTFRRDRLGLILFYMAYGAAAVWGSDLVIHVYFVAGMTGGDMTLLLGLCLPLAGVGAYALMRAGEFFLRRLFGESEARRPAVALFMTAGIWVFGPVMIWISQLVEQNSLGEWWELGGVILLTAMFPISLLIMSVWDCSFLGLAGVTMVMTFVCAAAREWRCWMLPLNPGSDGS